MCWYCGARNKIMATGQFSIDEACKCHHHLVAIDTQRIEDWPSKAPAAVEDLLAKLLGPNGRTILAILEIRNTPE